jgi:3-deoxy-D-manno-octulosonic-acid transferase
VNRFVYNALLVLFAPLIVAYLLYRRAIGKEDPAHWGERWGNYAALTPSPRPEPVIWVHAVSVGEVMAAVPVLRALRERYPDGFLLLTTTTVGGREVASQRTEPDAIATFPLDFPFAVGRALCALRPDLIVLMEWEIWPNFLVAAKRLGARIAVLNGRVSDKGLRRGQRARFFTRPGLDAVDRFAMQSDEDARRAVRVGADAARVTTLGNTKFDESVAALTDAERQELRAELGIAGSAPVLVCGSTRESRQEGIAAEEVQLAEAVERVRARHPDLVVIVAPRHRERADSAAAAFPGAGRRSRGEPVRSGALILDTFGELGRIYGAADLAFVGGSLVPWGGQSVFQPLAQGVPTLFGPHMNNQRDIAALARAEGVGFEVADAAALADELLRLLALSPAERARLTERARALIARNQGVSKRGVDLLDTLLAR